MSRLRFAIRVAATWISTGAFRWRAAVVSLAAHGAERRPSLLNSEGL